MTDPMSRVVETRYGPAPTQPPLVSVLMITYNHEAFIREAIESVFMQEVDFPIELVIGEDCSTDGTLDEIQSICHQAPVPVRLLTSATNVGMHGNFRRTLRACKGKYVALLEGDDVWILRDKLKLQVKILDSFPDKSFCYHQAISVCTMETPTARRNFESAGNSWPSQIDAAKCLADARKRLIIPTASVMFRRHCFFDVPMWFDRLPWCDWPLYLSLFKNGDAYFIPVAASKYNIHQGGVSETIDGNSYHYGAAVTFLEVSKGLGRRERADLLLTALDYWSRYVNGSGLVRGRSIALFSCIVLNGLFSVAVTKNAFGRLFSAVFQ